MNFVGFEILELLIYSVFFIVYLVMVLHSVSVVTRLRDTSFQLRVLAFVYFLVILVGMPFVFVTYILTQ